MGKRLRKSVSPKAIAAELDRKKRRFLFWMMFVVGGLFVALFVASIVAPGGGGVGISAVEVNRINRGGVGNRLFYTR